MIQLNSLTLDLTYFIYSDAQYHSGNALPAINYTVDGQRQQRISLKNQPVGNYLLIVGTAEEGDLGNYSLTVEGLTIKPTKIAFDLLESSNQTWSEVGSGGSAFGNYKSNEFLSERNPRYTFTINQTDSWIDIELLGEKGDINGALYDQQGKQLYTYGERYAVSTIYGIQLLKTGTYTLVVGSYTRNQTGTFKIRLSGHISTLSRKETLVTSFTDKWTLGEESFNYFQTKSNERSHLYQVDLDSESTILDLALTTREDISAGLFLVDEKRNYLASSQIGNGSSLIAGLSKGRYYILVASTTTLGGVSEYPYKLFVYGNVKEVKEL